jgi:hypothetical protein
MIYAGGASIQNPTAGEQVLIGIFDRQRGVSAVPCVFYHSASPPPATNLPKKIDGYSGDAGGCVPGDLVISAPPAQPHDGGSDSPNPSTFIRLRKDGTIQIWSAGMISADVIGGMQANVNTGDVDLTVAKGSVNVTAATSVNFDVPVVTTSGNLSVGSAATGSITDSTGRVATVMDGIVVNIN